MKFCTLILLLFLACQPLPKNVPVEKYRNQFIKGRIEVSKNLQDKIPPKDYFLIISVRSLDNPMPLAVLRVKNPELPYDFKITGKHKLTHDRVMEGEVILIARISKEPNAELVKGDLVGSVNTKVGTKGVLVKIDTEVQ